MYFRSSSDAEAQQVYYLGEVAAGGTLNVAAKYAGYANLKVGNFIVEPSSSSSGSFSYRVEGDYRDFYPGTDTWLSVSGSSTAVSKSYNASTGRLTVSMNTTVSSSGTRQITTDSGESWTNRGAGSTSFAGKCKVYLVEGTIKNL